MRQLLYVSNTRRDLPAGALNSVLTAARRNNDALGITGMLLFIDGGFLQILEGDERALRELYARIHSDPRHWNMRILLNRDTHARAFDEWSMGFERPSESDVETAGLFAITRDALEGKLSPGAGRVVATMLETFYRVQTGDVPGLRRTG